MSLRQYERLGGSGARVENHASHLSGSASDRVSEVLDQRFFRGQMREARRLIFGLFERPPTLVDVLCVVCLLLRQLLHGAVQ